MTYEDYLAHSSECYHAVYGPQPRNRRRSLNFKPKYVAKEGNRYFYSQAEYDAFKRGGRRKASTNLYTQNVRQRAKDATTYGPSPRRSSGRTSLAKRSRPKLVKMQDSFMSSLRDLRRKAFSAISRGREIANGIFSSAKTKISEFRGVAAWKISEFKAKAATTINRGKKFIQNILQYREKKRIGEEYRRSRPGLDPRIKRTTNTERSPAQIPEWMRRK